MLYHSRPRRGLDWRCRLLFRSLNTTGMVFSSNLSLFFSFHESGWK